MEWIHLAKNKNQWQGIVKTVTNIKNILTV